MNSSSTINSFRISGFSIFSFLTLSFNLSIKSITVLTPISAIINISSNSSKYSSLTLLYLLVKSASFETKPWRVFVRPFSYILTFFLSIDSFFVCSDTFFLVLELSSSTISVLGSCSNSSFVICSCFSSSFLVSLNIFFILLNNPILFTFFIL